MMDRIMGERGLQMPWEGAQMTRSLRRKLGVFKDALMQLVDRDPAKRPSMADFCHTCNQVLGGTSMTMDLCETESYDAEPAS